MHGPTLACVPSTPGCVGDSTWTPDCLLELLTSKPPKPKKRLSGLSNGRDANLKPCITYTKGSLMGPFRPQSPLTALQPPLLSFCLVPESLQLDNMDMVLVPFNSMTMAPFRSPRLFPAEESTKTQEPFFRWRDPGSWHCFMKCLCLSISFYFMCVCVCV